MRNVDRPMDIHPWLLAEQAKDASARRHPASEFVQIASQLGSKLVAQLTSLDLDACWIPVLVKTVGQSMVHQLLPRPPDRLNGHRGRLHECEDGVVGLAASRVGEPRREPLGGRRAFDFAARIAAARRAV
jgi:hypothetical protein